MDIKNWSFYCIGKCCDSDDCIIKSCKSDNPQVLKQIARAPRSDLKNYFRRVRDPIQVGSDPSSGGKTFAPGKKRKRRKSQQTGGITGGAMRPMQSGSAFSTQGPLWGTNLELTKNFRIEYDVARFGPAVSCFKNIIFFLHSKTLEWKKQGD